jgi:hypothetical protein
MRPRKPTKSSVKAPARGDGKSLSGKSKKTNTFYRQNNDRTPSSTTRGKVKSKTSEGTMKIKAASVKPKKAAPVKSKESSVSNRAERPSTNLAALKTASDIVKRKPKASF